MLKSSSLCLYNSNLGTFWLKIEQFWPFEEISIFSNGGHLGYRTVLTDTILKGSFQQSLVEIGSIVSEKIFFLISSPFFLICIIGQNR
jgi:ABC-type sugar transport system permease subunit